MSNRKSQSHSRSLFAMGFFRLPSENPAAPAPSESRDVSHQQEEPMIDSESEVATTGEVTLETSSPAAAEASNQPSTQILTTGRTSEVEVTPAAEAPNQPSGDYNFPKRKFGGANRSFQSSWTKQFPWLHYNESNDSVFCWYCMRAAETQQLKSSKSEVSFISRGYTNWKNATAGFRKHESTDCHKEAVEIHLLPQQCVDISVTFQKSLIEERQSNRKNLFAIIRSIRFLARQGLALRGHSSDEGNFIQLLKLLSETEPALQSWLAKEREKYTSGEIQNEILRLMAHSILRKISQSVHNNTLMADEVTDSSNREQFVICLRWVDGTSLAVNEDLVGFYQVDDITAATLFSSLKDVLLRLNINIRNCRAQCFDGASNMVGARSGVATLVQKEEPRAILVHCYGHSLQLAVCDTVKQIRIMSDSLDTTNEISKLLKYSPKRDTLFDKIKKELAPDTPGFRVLCPTRWTVRANSLKSVIDNWLPLLELWDECLTQKNLESEVKSRIIGVRHQMETFEYFFGTSLGLLLLQHSDNLSKTLQHTFMSASEGQSLCVMTVTTLKVMRSDKQFDIFWTNVTTKGEKLGIGEPVLPRKRKRPERYEPHLILPAHQSPYTRPFILML